MREGFVYLLGFAQVDGDGIYHTTLLLIFSPPVGGLKICLALLALLDESRQDAAQSQFFLQNNLITVLPQQELKLCAKRWTQ